MAKLSPLSVNIIYNKANTYGLNDDVQVIDSLLRQLQDVVGPINKARTADLREPLNHSDINIHLEIPMYLEEKDYFLIEWGKPYLRELIKIIGDEFNYFELQIEINPNDSRNFYLKKI
jgi:hypothetical protein